MPQYMLFGGRNPELGVPRKEGGAQNFIGVFPNKEKLRQKIKDNLYYDWYNCIYQRYRGGPWHHFDLSKMTDKPYWFNPIMEFKDGSLSGADDGTGSTSNSGGNASP